MDKIKKTKIALFRFGVISGILAVRETDKGQRERLIGEVTSKQWDIPYCGRSYIGRSTVRDWIRSYEQSGNQLESLFPDERSDLGKSRSMDEETEAALIRIKKEMRSASLPTVLREAKKTKALPENFSASAQSVYRLFKRHGLDEPVSDHQDMRRFEAELPNDLWQSDCLHGPPVIVEGKQRKAFGFVFLDDHSRLIPHGEFYLRENIESFAEALKKALVKRGLPGKLYVDNGPYFRSHHLEYVCASLGISLVHCTAYRPEGKGKIERFNRTIRTQFLSTITGVVSLDELNERFHHWIDSQYHLARHSSTSEKPIERYVRHLHLIRSAPKNINDYFRMQAQRTVDKDRTLSLLGKLYEAPVELIQRKVTLLYNADDPTRVEALYNGKSYGFLVTLNAHVNCRIRRRHQVTELVAPENQSAETEPSYHGGILFHKENDDDEL